MCTGVLPACMFTHHLWAWCPWRPEGGIGCCGTRVKTVVSCHVDARNQTQVLWKSSQYSCHWPISLGPRFIIYFLCTQMFCLHVCLCTEASRGHSQMVVSCPVGTGTHTWVLWKSKPCSFPLSLLSRSSKPKFFKNMPLSYFYSLIIVLYMMGVWMCAHTCHSTHMKSEDDFRDLVPSFHHGFPG